MLEKIKSLPLAVKIIICIFCPVLIPFALVACLLGPTFSFAAKENQLFSNLVNYPSEENAKAYIELMRHKPAVTLAADNHPSSWAVLREKWNMINRSNKIPSDMKKEILNILINKGLYLNNSKIINNYKADTSFNDATMDTTMQDEINRQNNEWAMEEARKSVTPFDHGGYVQGDGFNPSDTMAADAQRQMDNMNNMNNMNMF